MKKTAIVLADKNLKTINGKTTHGLLRCSDRFEILAVIDSEYSGRHTKEVLGDDYEDVPIYASMQMALNVGLSPEYCICGIATHGGELTVDLKKEFFVALTNGISAVNGLHQFLSQDPEMTKLARENELELIDVRKPKPRERLRFWNGEVYEVGCPIIAVLGTDCAIGKRTTSQWLTRYCNSNNLTTEMIYTGQTGWLQGADYGFIFDSTVNDFVSGELEGAIVNCWKNKKPELMILEGQSSLRNPSGPCGPEFLISGQAKGVVLQHAPGREHYDGYEELDLKIPSIESEVQLIESLGSTVLAISLNCENMTDEEINHWKTLRANELERPVVDIRTEGCQRIYQAVKDWMS